MYNDDKFDELLHEAVQEDKDQYMKFGPDFSKIEREALTALRKKSNKHKVTVVLRIATAFIGAVILLNTFLFFADFEPVKAYQQQVKKFVFNLFSSQTNEKIEAQYFKESTEIQKVQNLVPLKITVPKWLPAGYSFNNIEMRDDGNDVYTVILKYSCNSDILAIDISNNFSVSNTIPSNDEGAYEKIIIDGNDVYIVSLSDGTNFRSKCYFYNKQGLKVRISGLIDRQSLISIIESMIQS